MISERPTRNGWELRRAGVAAFFARRCADASCQPRSGASAVATARAAAAGLRAGC
jgi:hypothetical protein